MDCSIERKTEFLVKLFEQEDAGCNKNLNFISHLNTSISIVDKQAREIQHNIEDMKEELEMELERERNAKLDAISVSPLVRENRKRNMSQFMPSFENILPSSSSEDSHMQGAPSSSASTQVSRATGSSVDLTSSSQVTVNIDTEDTTSANISSASTSTSISGSSTGATSESDK
jgi:hypothetical protein